MYKGMSDFNHDDKLKERERAYITCTCIPYLVQNQFPVVSRCQGIFVSLPPALYVLTPMDYV